jgi:hypothetical protein
MCGPPKNRANVSTSEIVFQWKEIRVLILFIRDLLCSHLMYKSMTSPAVMYWREVCFLTLTGCVGIGCSGKYLDLKQWKYAQDEGSLTTRGFVIRVLDSSLNIIWKTKIRVSGLRFSRRWLWRMTSSGMLRGVALVRTDVSEEFTLMMRHYVPPKRRFLQEPHEVTSQKTPFFRVTAVKISNLTHSKHGSNLQTDHNSHIS